MTEISDVRFHDLIDSKLGLDMANKHGWTSTEFQAIREFTEDLPGAIASDRRTNGPRAKRLKVSLATKLGAELSRVENEDRIADRQGLGAIDLTQHSYRDAVRCAVILSSL